MLIFTITYLLGTPSKIEFSKDSSMSVFVKFDKIKTVNDIEFSKELLNFKQKQILYDSLIVNSISNINKLFIKINNKSPVDVVDKISLQTNLARSDITKAIELKILIYKIYNFITILLLLILITFSINVYNNKNWNWKKNIIVSGLALIIIFITYWLLPPITNYIVNDNYILITELKKLSG